MNNKKTNAQANEAKGFLAWVERVGNALPHPAMIFVIMIVILAVVAQICYMNNISVDFFDAREGKVVE